PVLELEGLELLAGGAVVDRDLRAVADCDTAVGRAEGTGARRAQGTIFLTAIGVPELDPCRPFRRILETRRHLDLITEVIAAGSRQEPPVRTEGHAGHPAAMAAQRVNRLARVHVPDPCQAIAADGQALAVRTEAQAAEPLEVPAHTSHRLA